VTSHLKIRDLELVVALCEEGTFTKAAKRVGITEPALSKRLLMIERTVQARLFERNHNCVTITEAGRHFVEHARECIHSLHCAVHEAHEAKRGEHHTLRIGASAYLPANLIKLLHTGELRLYHDLAIEVVSEYSAELLAQLQRRQIDLALVTSPPPSAVITTLLIATNPFMIAFREGHPLAAKKSVTLAEIVEYPWIFFSRNVHPPLHDQILHRVEAEHGRPPNIIHHVSQVDQVPALLVDDKLLVWLYPHGAQKAVDLGLRSIPLEDEHLHLETHLATLANNKSQLVSEYVRNFVTRFQAHRLPEQLLLPIA
jgi:DNA-binding transcriptional LysR family regulator